MTGFVRESRGVLEPLIRDKSDYPSINIQKIYIYTKRKRKDRAVVRFVSQSASQRWKPEAGSSSSTDTHTATGYVYVSTHDRRARAGWTWTLLPGMIR